MRTLGLSFLVALGTLIAMAIAGFGLLVSGGIVFPLIVAWAAASLFAFGRRPRYLWLQVAAIGVLVAALLSFYLVALPRLFPPPPGYLPGGPNMLPPPQ